MYGNPDDIAKKLEELRDAGVGYVLINGGGSGGGARGRESLRRFARDVMPMFGPSTPLLIERAVEVGGARTKKAAATRPLD